MFILLKRYILPYEGGGSFLGWQDVMGGGGTSHTSWRHVGDQRIDSTTSSLVDIMLGIA